MLIESQGIPCYVYCDARIMLFIHRKSHNLEHITPRLVSTQNRDISDALPTTCID